MKTASDLFSSDFIKVDASDTVSSLIGKLIVSGQADACVFRNGNFLGLFSHRLLLKSRIEPYRMKVSSVTVAVPELRKSHDVVDIATLMFDSNSVMLPVVDKRFLGIVRVHDVLKNLEEIKVLRDAKVKEARHPSVVSIREDETVNNALELMRKEHIDRLPVVDGRGLISGFISHIDIMKKFYVHPIERDDSSSFPKIDTRAFSPQKKHLLSLPVKDFMSYPLIFSISENENLSNAARKMSENNVLSLLIMKDDQPISILTKRDILEAIMASRIPELRNIQFVGLEQVVVSDFTLMMFRKAVSYHAEKLGWLAKNKFRLFVHVKAYNKAGVKRKYSMHSRIILPGGIVASCNSHDWDLRRALHKSLDGLRNRLLHRFKANIRESPSVRMGI